MDLIHRRAPDYVLLFAIIALIGIGVVMVYSASSIVAQDQVGDSAFFFKRQAMWAAAGFIALLVVQRVHYEKLRRITPALLLIALTALVLVLVPGVGRVVGGARRWISLGGPFAFQPAEAAKLALVLYLANFLSNRGPAAAEFRRGVLPPLIVLGMMFVLILAQPDMGTALLLALVTVLLLFMGGARIWHLAGLAFAGAPLVAIAVFGADYRRQRILAFLNPWGDPQGSGFHIIQSLLALGSGGLLGMGLGNSRQKFFYLPERHTDFIFSILGEELGLIGTLAVVLLLAVVVYRGFQIARRAPDQYGALLAGGITGLIVLQAVLNIGVTTGLLPITGVPLPFVSFGGSSLLVMMIGVGIVLNISQYTGSRDRGIAGSSQVT
ncbi:MAG TPA: putative lipid II flippase FtsW [bacterium]|jgi:cell division protein FtsW